jgi:hypothetical protein
VHDSQWAIERKGERGKGRGEERGWEKERKWKMLVELHRIVLNCVRCIFLPEGGEETCMYVHVRRRNVRSDGKTCGQNVRTV